VGDIRRAVEEWLLTEEWSRMSDADIETFLNTPGIVTVEPMGTEESLNGQNDLVPIQSTNPVMEDLMEIIGINEGENQGENQGGLEGDSFNFFDNVVSDSEFVIHSDTIYYEDSVYNSVYSCFNNDSFF